MPTHAGERAATGKGLGAAAKAVSERVSSIVRLEIQLAVSELKRIKELEGENTKLKRMYAELALENAAIKDVLQRKL